MMRIIPAIDLQQGQCVRLRQGKFNRTTIYPTDPIALAKSYKDEGAKALHIVDLDGAKSGEIEQLLLIKHMCNEGITVQVGGGIRNIAKAQACLEAKISKLVLGSIAINDRALTQQLIDYAGARRIVLALDVSIQNGVPIPATHGWQTMSSTNLWDVVKYYQKTGVSEILCTDIACDGMMGGPNIELYQEAIKRFPNMDWQASGGIRNQQDIEILRAIGLRAAIVGRALYESKFDLSDKE
jgi:phosphoribosylformimino-5-aminoimidazole carboxamide ribotide isomerase